MTELVIVRHGETDWNLEKRLQGHSDIGLNATGERQAYCLANALRGERFDAIYASDLRRAMATAQAIAVLQGHTVHTLSALRERHYGVFEGVPQIDLPRRFPHAFATWKARQPDAELPGGERLEDFHLRICHTVLALARAHPTQRLLIATHGGVLDSVYRLCTGTALSTPRTWELPNTGINRLQYDADSDRLTLMQWAEIGHWVTQPLPTDQI